MTGLEIALRHAFNERDEEIARLRAEIAVLTEQRDRAMKALRKIASGECMSYGYRQTAEDALDAPSLPESPEA